MNEVGVSRTCLSQRQKQGDCFLFKNKYIESFLSKFDPLEWEAVVEATLAFGIQNLGDLESLNSLNLESLYKIIEKNSTKVAFQETIPEIQTKLSVLRSQLERFSENHNENTGNSIKKSSEKLLKCLKNCDCCEEGRNRTCHNNYQYECQNHCSTVNKAELFERERQESQRRKTSCNWRGNKKYSPKVCFDFGQWTYRAQKNRPTESKNINSKVKKQPRTRTPPRLSYSFAGKNRQSSTKNNNFQSNEKRKQNLKKNKRWNKVPSKLKQKIREDRKKYKNQQKNETEAINWVLEHGGYSLNPSRKRTEEEPIGIIASSVMKNPIFSCFSDSKDCKEETNVKAPYFNERKEQREKFYEVKNNEKLYEDKFGSNYPEFENLYISNSAYNTKDLHNSKPEVDNSSESGTEYSFTGQIKSYDIYSPSTDSFTSDTIGEMYIERENNTKDTDEYQPIGKAWLGDFGKPHTWTVNEDFLEPVQNF